MDLECLTLYLLKRGDTAGPRLSDAICGPGGLPLLSPALCALSSGYVSARVLP